MNRRQADTEGFVRFNQMSNISARVVRARIAGAFRI